MGKWMAVLAFLVTVMVLVVERGAANEARVAAEAEAEQESVAARCEEYGREAERIVEARNPTPESERGSGLLADDGGYTGIPIYANARVPPIRWFCKNSELVVDLRGSWLLDAADATRALENLLADFEDSGLDARRDGLEIELGLVLHGGVARFDPRAERSQAITAE
ncbi:MAG: hypothetical protein HKN10_02130 [Myxococcales bacterium]|nr:hypothetical protein [Myxococcales bacterium]